MLCHIDSLTQMVRMAMGRNARSHPAIDCLDDAAVSLDRRIAACIPKAARRVVADAPVTSLGDIAVDISDTDVCWDSGDTDLHSGHILLPADYLRLVCFRMADWHRTLHTADATDSPAARLQSAAVAAIRGVPERPAAYIRAAPEGLLLCFSACRDTDTVIAEAAYAPIPGIDPEGYIRIPRLCIDALITETLTLLK